MGHATKQRGLSMIGFLFVAVVVMVVIVVGARTVPAYIEYYTIQKDLEKALRDTADPTSIVGVRESFKKYVQTDYIDSVMPNDVEVTKQGNEATASIAWNRQLHMVGNVSLYLEFNASATR